MPLVSPGGRTPPVRLLRAAEVAALLAVTPRTVRALADRGELRRVRLSSRAVRYELAEVEALIVERTVQNDHDPGGKSRAAVKIAGGAATRAPG